VIGSAAAMQIGGLSMAMGAFLAGVLLSESTFRHQLEADIEPFRGILLGLFFLGVGMSLDLGVVAREWVTVLAAVAAAMVVKSIGVYAVARLFRAKHGEAMLRTALLAQGGEFAFVLYAAANAAGLLPGSLNATLTATVIISMVLTPLLVLVVSRLLPEAEQSFDGVEKADGLEGRVLIIGFGRFGQVASQLLLARGVDVSIIDMDTEMIRAAGDFGFKVYYGDGTRLDILHAAGADKAEVIAICVDKRDTADRIVELCKSEFPLMRVLVRSYDREHALKLVKAGVTLQVRETFESAIKFGQTALVDLDVPESEAAEIADDIRRRDAERFALEMTGGLLAGSDLLHSNVPRPTPFTQPKRKSAPKDAPTA
jgi:glutathione-regulated potassium-efflux system protein KefB